MPLALRLSEGLGRTLRGSRCSRVPGAPYGGGEARIVSGLAARVVVGRSDEPPLPWLYRRTQSFGQQRHFQGVV